MAHSRKDIRTGVMNLLVGNTAAGQNVFKNVGQRVFGDEYPIILIQVVDEVAIPRATGSRQSHRTLTLQVVIVGQDNETIDDTLDDISTEVENLFEQDPSLGGNAQHTIYLRTELERDASGEAIVGKNTLTFEVKYID